MKKNEGTQTLKLGDILIMAVGGFSDIYKTMRGSVYEQYRECFYGHTSPQWQKRHFQSLVSRSVNSHYIHKMKDKHTNKLTLTSQGIEKIKQKFPNILYKNCTWDKKWRIAIFDIAEINRTRRNKLRRDLKRLGFGMIQKSVWLSPHNILPDVRKYIIDRNIPNNIILLETSSLEVGNIKEFARQIWPLDHLNNQYKTICQQLKPENITKDKFPDIFNAFILCSLKDPYLPPELLPDDWHYSTAVKLIKKLRQKYCNL